MLVCDIKDCFHKHFFTCKKFQKIYIRESVATVILTGKMSEQNLNTILNRFTANIVQLRQQRKIEALNCWEPIVKEILEYVKTNDDRFSALQILPTGSYYERAKVKEPDEFDLMLIMDNLELDDAPFEEDDGFSEPPIGKIRPV